MTTFIYKLHMIENADLFTYIRCFHAPAVIEMRLSFQWFIRAQSTGQWRADVNVFEGK